MAAPFPPDSLLSGVADRAAEMSPLAMLHPDPGTPVSQVVFAEYTDVTALLLGDSTESPNGVPGGVR